MWVRAVVGSWSNDPLHWLEHLGGKDQALAVVAAIPPLDCGAVGEDMQT